MSSQGSRSPGLDSLSVSSVNDVDRKLPPPRQFAAQTANGSSNHPEISQSEQESKQTTPVSSGVRSPANANARRVVRKQRMEDQQKLESSMPASVLFLYTHCIKPCFTGEETFDVLVRKVGILTMACMCSMAPVMLIWIPYQVQDHAGWTSHRIGITGICIFCFGVLQILHYIYIRRTRAAPNWMAHICCLAGPLVMTVFTTTNLFVDSTSLLCSTVLLTTMLSTNMFSFHLIFHCLVYLYHLFRTRFREDEIPQLAFSWDNDYMSLVEKVCYMLISTIPVITTVGGLWVIIRSYLKKSNEAQVTNIMTITIADQLQRYDTQAVAHTLKEHEGSVSNNLLHAFEAIRENLESFRPHIPRYLIEAAIERAEEAEELALIEEIEQELGTVSDSVSTAKRARGLKNGGDDDDENSEENEISEGSFISTSSSIPDGSLNRTDSGVGIAVRSPHDRHHLHHSHHQSANQKALGAIPGVQSGFKGNITCVYLQLIDNNHPDTAVSERVSFTELNEAIEALNRLATSTAASVHHVDAGVMAVSWNATKRIHNHEMKACRFASKAMTTLENYPTVHKSAAAAILTCPSSAFFAGTTQMHFVLSHEELMRHRYLLEVANKHKTIVCTPSVTRSAETQFNFLGFAADTKYRLIFELVSSKESDVNNDSEWMYAINNTTAGGGGGHFSKVTAAAALALLPAATNAQPNSWIQTHRISGDGQHDDDDDDRNMSPMDLLNGVPADVVNRSTVQELVSRVADTL